MANLGQIDTNESLRNFDQYIQNKKLGSINVQSEPTEPAIDTSKAQRLARYKEIVGKGETSNLGDYVRTFGAGVPEVGGVVAELGRRVGVLSDQTAQSIQDNAKLTSERLRSKTSPTFQKASSQPLISKDDKGDYSLNPDYSSTTLAHDIVASAPGTIATGLGAGGLMKAGGAILSPILSRLGIGEVVASNFPKLSQMAESLYPGAGSAAAKVNKMIATGVAAKGGASISEGLVAAGQNSYQKRQEIESTPFDKLANSPAFQEALSSQDQSLPLDQRMNLARSIIANKASDDVFHQTFASTSGISALTGGGVIGDILSKSGGKITGSLIKSIGKGAGEEFLQEAPQSGMEQAISNIADKAYVNPNKDVMEGVADAFLKGGITGAATGGGLGGLTHISSKGSDPTEKNKKVESVVSSGVEVPITSGKAKGLLNKYLGVYEGNPEPNNPEYIKVKDEILASLDDLIKTSENKKVDPTLKGEVDAIKKHILSGHEILTKDFERDQEEEKVKAEATVEASKPITPEEPVVPDSSEVITGEDLVTEPSAPLVPSEQSGQIAPEELKGLMDEQSINKEASPEPVGSTGESVSVPSAPSVSTDTTASPIPLPTESKGTKESNGSTPGIVIVDDSSLTTDIFSKSDKSVESGNYLPYKLKTGEDIKVVHAINSKGDSTATAYDSNNVRIGVLSYSSDPSYQSEPSIHVDSDWRRKGVATALYDSAEEMGGNIPPLDSNTSFRTHEGKAFRESRDLSKKGTPRTSQESDESVRQHKITSFNTSITNRKKVIEDIINNPDDYTDTALQFAQESLDITVKELSKLSNEVSNKSTKPKSLSNKRSDFHSSISKDYEGTANLSSLTTAKLPEIISAKFSDLSEVPVRVIRTTKNSLVVRAGYSTTSGGTQLTKEFSIPRTSINSQPTNNEIEASSKELITPVASPIPLESFKPVEAPNEPIGANVNEVRVKELQLQLEDARAAGDHALSRELKQEIEDLGGKVGKVKLDQKKINANLSAEKSEDEESDEAIDNIYGDKESYINLSGDDVDVEYSLEDKGTPTFSPNHEENKKALDYIFSKMKGSKIGSMINAGDLEIHYVPDFTDPDYQWPKVIKRENAQVSFSPRAKGIHIRDNSNNKTYIFLNGIKARDPGSLIRTFAHEAIGHYGIRSIFGQSKAQLDNYLVRLINSNRAFRESIFSKSRRWVNYYDSWVVDYMASNQIKEFETAIKSISQLPSSEVVMYQGKPIPIEVAIQLADEEMAEIAADLFYSEKFLKEQVGLGDRSARLPKSTIRKSWLNNFLNRVKHLIRKVFGNYTNEISTDDLTQMIAESVDRLFEVTPTSHLKTPPSVRREFIYENIVKPKTTLSLNKNLELREEMDELTNEDIVHNEYTTDPLIHNISSFVEAAKSTDTNLNENVRSRMWGKLIESIKNSRLRGVLVYGDMPHSEVYSHIDTVYKGGVGRIEETAKKLVKELSNINSIQNSQIFHYMTTANSDPGLMDITSEQRKVVVDTKEAIKELGRVSAELGIINKDVYEKNKDAYLHTTYLDFVNSYKGSGKRTSIMSYSFKKKNKTERQRAELGQIKDVRFLIPETFGVLARDHVLLEMFSTINEASIVSDLHWVLSSKEKIKLPGTNQKATVEDAYKYLDNLRYIYEQRSSGNDVIFGEEVRGAPLDLIKSDLDTLETDLKSLEARLVSQAHKASGRTDLTTEEFLRENYTRLPTSKKLGGLSGKFVRKEIANDLEAFTSAYNLDNSTTLQKFFARGGTLERMNSFWKTGKIALNPASWFRNIVGNFSLLDLSTSTPSYKLIGMLHEEISRAINPKESEGEYWTLAKHYGLFGTTFSAIELQSFFNNYGDELIKARATREKRVDSAWDKHLSHFDEMLTPIFRMAGHKIGGSTAKGFAFVEGAFKTVAFRDYVQTWEKQNGLSYKDLTGEKQNVLLAKAASHANDAIIDYSKAHAIVKDLRRLPFGDPFLTFTYKSLPIMLKSMVNHPIKFAKYATLPALLTMISLAANDWEDKDWEKVQKGMTDYHRDNPGMFLFPWKDSTGRMQIADAGYLIPWNQWHTAAKKAYRVYEEDGGESPFASTGKAIYNVSNELGFMGGPAPQVVAAFITGKDSFTGEDIAKPGTSADQKFLDYMKYSYNMAVPGWVSSSGWFSKLADAYGIGGTGDPTVDRFGDIKFTPGQAWADITGFRAVGVKPETGIENRQLGYQQKLRDISTARSKMLRDKNLSSLEKQSQLKDFVLRGKLVRKQMIEAR